MTIPNKAEREAFERHIAKDCGDLTTFGSGSNLHYRNSAVNNAWAGWIARAALAIPHPEAAPQAGAWLSPQDQTDLERLNDLFSDDMPWDLEKVRMQHLAALGVIRRVTANYYAITAFGRHCIATEWGLPLRTVEQINAEQDATHAPLPKEPA